MIYRENPNFVAREIQPNPREVSYWIDLSESPQGQIIKTWVSGKWVKINPSDAEQGGLDLTEVKQAINNLETNKADKYEVQQAKDEIWQDTYSKQQVNDKLDDKEDTLVSGVTIKTINGNSLLGSGNITIQAEGGDIDLSGYITTIEADNKYQPKGAYLTSIPPQYVTDTELEDYALKTDIPDTDQFITEEEANATYQPKGSYLTSVPAEYVTESELSQKGYATTEQIPDISTKQDTLVSGTNIKTINNQSILGQGNIEITTGTGGITDAPSDGTIYGRQNGNWVEVNVDTSDLATKEELLQKADAEDVASQISTEASSRAQEDNRLSNLIEDETEAREAAVTTLTSNKLDKSTYNSDKLTFALKSEIPTDYLTAEDLPDTSNFATKQEVQAKQDTLISGTNIKTINGASVLGEGNITIETPEGGISDAPQDGKTYGRKDAQWSEIVIPDTSALATKAEIADMATQTWVGEQGYLTEHQDISNLATKEELASKANASDLSNYLTTANASTIYETISGAQSKYQPVGEYALKSEIPSLSGYATESYVNTQVSNLVNSAPEALDTLDELAAALNDDANFATTVTNQIAAKLDITTYTSDKETFALKTELSSKADSSALANYLTTATAESTYAKKSEIPQQSLLPYDFFGEVEYTYVSGGTDTITISGDKYSTYCIGSGTVNVTFGTLIEGVEYHLLVRSNAGTITLGIPDLGAKYEVFVIGDKTQFTIEDNSILEMSFMLYGGLIVCRVSEPSSYTIAYNNTSEDNPFG